MHKTSFDEKIFLIAFFVASTFSVLKAQNDSIKLIRFVDFPSDGYYGQRAEDSDEVVTFADEMPQFPGGDSAKIIFLKDHLIYPTLAF